MKRIAISAAVFMLALGLAATASTVVAQNRPDCLTAGHPGACFVDGEDSDIFNLCGNWVTYGVIEFDGTLALWTFPSDADDFVRVITINGKELLHLNDTQADLWVCPASAGGIACLFEYFETCVVPEGMLTGTGRLNGTGAGATGSCPHLAVTGDGTVTNQSGQTFEVMAKLVLRPDPSDPQSSTQCLFVQHELTVTLE